MVFEECVTNKLHFSFLVMFVCREDVGSFYFLKKRNILNFRSFCVLNIGEMTLSKKPFYYNCID